MTPDTPESLPVTQADREAAASGYYAWLSSNPVMPAKMRAGQADDHSMVQAFARHRIHSPREGETELAGERDELFDALGFILGADPGPKSQAAYAHAREVWTRISGVALHRRGE